MRYAVVWPDPPAAPPIALVTLAAAADTPDTPAATALDAADTRLAAADDDERDGAGPAQLAFRVRWAVAVVFA